MIRHVVCYQLKDPSPLTLNRTKEVLLSMRGRVPEVLDIEVGIDFLKSERSYDLILQVTLKDRASLDSYQSDTYHCAVVKTHMLNVKKTSISVDYEF